MSLPSNHWSDAHIDDLRAGRLAMTQEERDHLCTTVPRFEESGYAESYYRGLSDVNLMNAAYGVWCDYTSGMY